MLRSNHQGCTNFKNCVFTFFFWRMDQSCNPDVFWPVGRISSNWMPHPPVRWPSTAPRRWSLCGCPTQIPPREGLHVQLKWLRQDSPDPPMMTFGMACRSLRAKKTREKHEDDLHHALDQMTISKTGFGHFQAR